MRNTDYSLSSANLDHHFFDLLKATTTKDALGFEGIFFVYSSLEFTVYIRHLVTFGIYLLKSTTMVFETINSYNIHPKSRITRYTT